MEQNSENVVLYDRDSLPVVHIYVDENGVSYLSEDDYLRLIRLKLPNDSYSFRRGEGRFFSLSPVEANAVFARNSLREHIAYQSEVENISSNDMVLQEDILEEPVNKSIGENNSESTVSTDIAIDNENSEEGHQGSSEEESIPEDDSTPSIESSTVVDSSTEESNHPDEQQIEYDSSDLEYRNLLQERVKQLQSRLVGLRGRAKHDITGHVYNQIKGHEREIEVLQEMINSMDRRPEMSVPGEGMMSVTDSFRDNNHSKQNQYEQQIAELKELRSNLLTARAQRRLDRRIEKLNRKISKLKKHDVYAGNVQRSILYPRYLYETRKRSLLLHAEGRVLAYQDRIQDNERIHSELDAMYSNSIVRGVHEFICDIKGMYYQNRLGRAQEILDEMNQTDSVIHMQGARITSLSKKYLEQIRQRRVEREREQNLSGGVVAAA